MNSGASGTPMALLRLTRAIRTLFSARIRASLALLKSTSALVTSNFGSRADLEKPLRLFEMLLELPDRLSGDLPVLQGLEKRVIGLFHAEDDLAA